MKILFGRPNSRIRLEILCTQKSGLLNLPIYFKV